MKKILFLLFCSVPLLTQAQIYPNIGQFQLVQLYYNPAFAGSGTHLRATGLYRVQNNKFPNTPNTQLITAEAPMGKNIGGGIVLNRHAAGDFQQVSFSANASYQIKTGRESFLQFGLKGGISQVNFGVNNAWKWDDYDAYLNTYATNGIIGSIGTGAYYKKKSFYAGLSLPDMFLIDPNKLFVDKTTDKSLVKKNVFFNTGVKINVTDFIALQPHAMIRYYSGRPLNYYINLDAIFNQTFTAGVGYMYQNVVALYTNVNITPKILLGYRYEFSVAPSTNQSYNSGGSNEVVLRYGFN
jgi:type IX secretion system PorP/SprF family membrane protein